MRVDDELYGWLRRTRRTDRAGHLVLRWELGGSDEDEPVLFTVGYGQGRVVQVKPGHTAKNCRAWRSSSCSSEPRNGPPPAEVTAARPAGSAHGGQGQRCGSGILTPRWADGHALRLLRSRSNRAAIRLATGCHDAHVGSSSRRGEVRSMQAAGSESVWKCSMSDVSSTVSIR